MFLILTLNQKYIALVIKPPLRWINSFPNSQPRYPTKAYKIRLSGNQICYVLHSVCVYLPQYPTTIRTSETLISLNRYHTTILRNEKYFSLFSLSWKFMLLSLNYLQIDCFIAKHLDFTRPILVTSIYL